MKKYIKATDTVGEVDANGMLYTEEEIIDAQEYMGRNDIKRVNAPNCKKVWQDAFYDCENLKEVNLPKCTYIGDSAFRGCTYLETIDCPKVEQIEEYAFYDCENLSSVKLPNCLKVKFRAFSGCVNLIDMNLPVDVIIGDEVFKYTPIDGEF